MQFKIQCLFHGALISFKGENYVNHINLFLVYFSHKFSSEERILLNNMGLALRNMFLLKYSRRYVCLNDYLCSVILHIFLRVLELKKIIICVDFWKSYSVGLIHHVIGCIGDACDSSDA